jgi:bilirubin oxidase
MRTGRAGFGIGIGAVLLALAAPGCAATDERAPNDETALNDLASAAAHPVNFTSALPIPPILQAASRDRLKVSYVLSAEQGGTHYFDSAHQGTTYAYSGGIPSEIRDSKDRIFRAAAANGAVLGPVIRLRQGEQVSMDFRANLDKPSNVHWHGLDVGPEVDVMPLRGASGGASTKVTFVVKNQAATLWYHPHQHMDEGRQHYQGLNGIVIIDDANSDALAAQGMPHTYGVDDIPLTFQDLRFDQNGKLRYIADDQDQDGMLGDQVALNGVIHPIITVTKTLVRFRLLNASNARAIKVGLSNKQKFFHIASDGGYLNAPLEVASVSLGPSERAEIVVDFSKSRTGKINLVSYSFAPLEAEDALEREDGDEAGLQWRNGRKYRKRTGEAKDDLANIRQGRPPEGFGFAVAQILIPTNLPPATLPQRLNSIAPPDPSVAVNVANPRVFKLEGPPTDDKTRNPQAIDFAATINGIKGDPEFVRVDQRVRAGSSEVWSIINDADDMMHPFHVHGKQFRVLERVPLPGHAAVRAPVEDGLKDTVQVFPPETVKILVNFDVPKGNFFFHCHVLEHIDMGMMGIFAVE